MTSPLLFAFHDAVVGRSCDVDRDDWTWSFVFGGGAAAGCTITATSWWRIISQNRIQLSVEDDGQQFGRPSPVIGLEQSRKLLSGSHAVDAIVTEVTSYLLVSFKDGTRLEIINSSSGYESWQANFRHKDDDVTLISGGGGLMDFVAVPAGARPSVVVGRRLPRD